MLAANRELEKGLIEQIQRFMLEMGVGLAFVGRKVHLEVSGRDYYLDMLFYHLKLRCFAETVENILNLTTDRISAPFPPHFPR